MRRSMHDLRLVILFCIERGVRKPTRIMYSSNISWKTLHKILNYLLDQELITVTSTTINVRGTKNLRKLYYLTPKGEKLVYTERMVLKAIGKPDLFQTGIDWAKREIP